ncbi:hypothetical protein NB700_001911 [Xanthomonas sacchari]|uniref:Uncharacterized protein n=1 Tax=Xanthomonas sacchari TaxID=56458 RepID=A0ABT3DWK0_9XANT|nr:hypothetical protein [Xanthomonas sacchari]MCW0399355.1 hypothetical protein [Xanthomonas sacchari]
MHDIINPKRLNALLEDLRLDALDPAQIEVLFASIPRPYAQSLVAGLEQRNPAVVRQFREWTITLGLHQRILVTISSNVALSNVYAACKLNSSKLIADLLASAERGDANAKGFLREHLATGFRHVKVHGLTSLLAISGTAVPMGGNAAGTGTTQSQREASPPITSMPPPDHTGSGSPPPQRQQSSQPTRYEATDGRRQHQHQQAPTQRQEGRGGRAGGGQQQHEDRRSPQRRDNGYSNRSVVDHPTRDRHQAGQGNAPRVPEESPYDQKACFGRDTAIQFERCVNNQGTNYTVNIAIAKANNGSTRGGVNWNDKIIMMCTPKEVQLILAVMRGVLPKVRFAGHGQGNDKWMEVEETSEQYAGAIRFTIARKDETRRVNVGPDDVGEVMSLFFRTAQAQLKQQDGYLVDLAIRRAADLHMKQQANKPQRPQGGQGGGQGGRNAYAERRHA